jgi:transcription antitermination factor NusG
MTTWYAVRTAPGAQMPQREYIVEKLIDENGKPRGKKGYRIVPSLNPNKSAVERALEDARIVHYMPCETKVIRDRHKTARWTTRRYPIVPGYVFVAGVEDWPALEAVPGVVGCVSCMGWPVPFYASEILTLRTIEAHSIWVADTEMEKHRRLAHAKSLRVAQKALASARKTFLPGKRVKVLYGPHTGRLATLAGWDDGHKVRAIIEGLESHEVLPFDSVRKVA